MESVRETRVPQDEEDATPQHLRHASAVHLEPLEHPVARRDAVDEAVPERDGAREAGHYRSFGLNGCQSRSPHVLQCDVLQCVQRARRRDHSREPLCVGPRWCATNSRWEKKKKKKKEKEAQQRADTTRKTNERRETQHERRTGERAERT